MNTDSRTLAIIGAVILAIGTFVPLMSVPILGSLNYFSNGEGDGIFILGFAAITLVLALIGQTRWVILPGIASLALTAYSFFQIRSRVASAEAELGSQLDGFAEQLGGFSLQWGWAVLLIGAIVVIFAGFRAWRARA